MKKINLPSLDNILANVESTFVRFPFVWVAALGATFSVILGTHYVEDSVIFPLFTKAAFISIVSFVVFLALELFFEREKSRFGKGLVIKAVVLLVAIGSYFLLPDDPFKTYALTIKFLLVWLFALALFFLSPFILHKEDNGFWQYIKFIGFSIAITGIYLAVLCIGSGLAIGGMKVLFDLQIPPQFILQFLEIIIGFVGGALFLSLLPKNIAELEETREKMVRFKNFGQYALLPIWSLYLVILYAYFVKVLIYQDWPKGIVVYLVSAFYFIGIFVHWYLFPFREDHKWIKIFGKVSSLLSLPLLGIYFWALGIRISQYGITIDRYLAITLGIWMMVMSVYYFFSKTISLRPAIFAAALGILLISFGPWSAFNLPERMQVGKLQNLLKQNGLFNNGKIVKVAKKISCQDKTVIEDQIYYLNRTYGYDFSGWGIVKTDSNLPHSYPQEVVTELGLSYPYVCDAGGGGSFGAETHFDYFGKNQETFSFLITGYDYVSQLTSPAMNNNVFTVSVNGKMEQITIKPDELVKKLRKIYQNPSTSNIPFQEDGYQLKIDCKNFTGKIIPSEFSAEEQGGKILIYNVRGVLLLKKK